jgi:hypothetical protein
LPHSALHLLDASPKQRRTRKTGPFQPTQRVLPLTFNSLRGGVVKKIAPHQLERLTVRYFSHAKSGGTELGRAALQVFAGIKYFCS